MKRLTGLLPFFVLFAGCDKNGDVPETPVAGCNMENVYMENAAKVTITNGIWGTVSSTEGNCMPAISPSSSACRTCPVKRIVKIYPYVLHGNATPSGNSGVFFDSFNVPLIAEAEADENGFFQVSIPPGRYTIAVLENGKLYANGGDGQGGINPFTLSAGRQKVDQVMTYKATF